MYQLTKEQKIANYTELISNKERKIENLRNEVSSLKRKLQKLETTSPKRSTMDPLSELRNRAEM